MASGGTTFGVKVSGGTLAVSSGGTVSGNLSLSGGNAIIAGTMSGGQLVKFTGSSRVLELANLAGFQAKISGLSGSAEKIELDGFQFRASETFVWTQYLTSGVLTVHDGSKLASLTLVVAYAASDFAMSADGKHGTFISDQHAALAPTRFVQTAAGLHGGRYQGGAALGPCGYPMTHAMQQVVSVATSGR